MKYLVLAALASVFGTTGAFAADVGGETADWSGFYLGVHGGYGTGEYEWTLQDNPGEGISRSQGEVVAEPDVDGMIGGFQLGLNAQRDNLVFGFEGELSFGNIEGSEDRIAGGEKPGPREWSSEMNWLATFGPRVGYAFDNTLLYVEGGLALINQDFYHLGAPGGSPPVSGEGREFDGDATNTGAFLGAGLEQSFGEDFSARLEYNYLDISGDAELWGKPRNPAIFGIDQPIHIIKLGVNYRLPM